MHTVTSGRVLAADTEGILRAAAILRRGGLVAFPTETVYGLGADATNGQAVAAIFAVKERPHINPLIVHVANVDQAKRLAKFHAAASTLADTFWPGALTLVLPRQENMGIALLATAGLDTIAIRVPSHPVAQALLKASDLPIAAPSANPSGRTSPTTAAHVASDLGDRVGMILDGGSVPFGIESTVVGFENDRPVLLRAGAVIRSSVEAVVGPLFIASDLSVRSPGRLKRHYAPMTPLRLKAHHVSPDEALLAFGPQLLPGAQTVRNLSPRGNLEEAAANLFSMMRELDASGATTIAVMPIPNEGLGEAITDRLQRAAARDD